MGIFSKKEKQEPSGPVYHTNAPDYWPKIPVPESVLKGDYQQGYVDFVRTLNSTLTSSGSGIEIRGLSIKKLDSEGVVDFPIALIDRQIQKAAVITHCPKFDDEIAARFNGLNNYLAKDDANAYYFSLEQLSSNRAIDPHRQFGWEDFEKFEDEFPKEEYAMWWGIEEQPDFPNSETSKSIDQVYENLEGYISYFYGLMLANLGLIESRTRVRIPEMADIPFIGPENKLIIMNVSQEKGVRFMFSVKSCPGEYRDNFLKAMAIFTKSFREFADEQKWEKDKPHEVYSPPLKWWRFAIESVKNQEQETTRFGLIFFGK